MPVENRYESYDGDGNLIVRTGDKNNALSAAQRTAQQSGKPTSVKDTVLNKSVEYGKYGNVTKCF